MKNKYVEIFRFFHNVYADYKTIDNYVGKADKLSCYLRIASLFFRNIWNSLTALAIYPIWYLFRKSITHKIYRDTSWQEIEKWIYEGNITEVEQKLKKNGIFLFWLWTYGDCHDPLGWGGMPESYGSKKNTFANRYSYSALRNPRFNINYMYFKTGAITQSHAVIDERDFSLYHKSYGIGDSPDGIYFKWLMDNRNKWYFIYEDNNNQHIFYFGYVGLLTDEFGKRGRFELAYRKTEGSYRVGIV